MLAGVIQIAVRAGNILRRRVCLLRGKGRMRATKLYAVTSWL